VVTLKTTKQEGLAFAVPSSDLLAALAASKDPASPVIIEAHRRGILSRAVDHVAEIEPGIDSSHSEGGSDGGT